MIANLVKFSILFLVCFNSYAQTYTDDATVGTFNLTGKSGTPANPETGFYRLYPKSSDGKLYLLNSSGLESLVGATQASGITYDNSTSLLLGDTVQEAIDELETELDGVATLAQINSAVSTHEADTTSVHGISNTANLFSTSSTIPVANGGTGQTSANAALNALLPTQTSNANKVLKTDGSNTSWADAGGGSGGINLLQNSNPEFNGGTLWSAVLGAVVPIQVYGSQDQIFDAAGYSSWNSTSAGQLICSASVSTGALASTNGEAYLWTKVPSGTATHKIRVFDGTNTLVQASITSTATATKQRINFPIPSSGTIRLCLEAIAADEPLIEFDKAYLGEVTNITSVENFSDFVATTVVLSNFGTATPVLTTKIRRAGDTQQLLFKMTTTTVGSGTGLVTITLPTGTIIDTAKFPVGTHVGQIVVGYATTTTRYEAYVASTTTLGISDASNYAIEGQDIPANSTWDGLLTFAVQGQSTNQSAAAANQTNYGNTSYTPTFSNFGTLGSSPSPVCTHRRDGEFLDWRCKFQMGTGAAAAAAISLPSGLAVSSAYNGTTGNIVGLCGQSVAGGAALGLLVYPGGTGFNISFFNQGGFAPTTPVNGNAMTASSVIDCQGRVRIEGWYENNKAPTLIGSVTSDSTSSIRDEWAYILNPSGTCTVSDQSSTWISSITSASGTCTLNFTGVANAPNCTANALVSPYYIRFNAASTTSSIVVNQVTDTAGLGNSSFYIHCKWRR